MAYELGRDLGRQGIRDICKLVHTEGGINVGDHFRIGVDDFNGSAHNYPTWEIAVEVVPQQSVTTIISPKKIEQNVMECIYLAEDDFEKGYVVPGKTHQKGSQDYHGLIGQLEMTIEELKRRELEAQP